jgi:hypothetical protein
MSANDAKGKILSLDEYRKQRHMAGGGPEPFDPKAFMQTITRARVAPSAEERELAVGLALRQAEELLQVVAIMGGEIAAFRQQIKSLAQQATDTATVLAVLLHEAGGVVEVDADWFAAWEPPTGSGFMVNEDPDRNVVVIRAIVVPPDEAVDSVSADQQTGGDRGAD